MDDGLYGASIIKSAMVDSHCTAMTEFLNDLQTPEEYWSDVEESPPRKHAAAMVAAPQPRTHPHHLSRPHASSSPEQSMYTQHTSSVGTALSRTASQATRSDAVGAAHYNNHLGIQDAVKHLPFHAVQAPPAPTQAPSPFPAARKPPHPTPATPRQSARKRVTITAQPPTISEISLLSLSSSADGEALPRSDVPRATTSAPGPKSILDAVHSGPPLTRLSILRTGRDEVMARTYNYRISIAEPVRQVHATRRQLYLTDTTTRRKTNTGPPKPAWRGGGTSALAAPSPARRGAFSHAQSPGGARGKKGNFKGALFGDLLQRQIAVLVMRTMYNDMHVARQRAAVAERAYRVGLLTHGLSRLRRNALVARVARNAETRHHRQVQRRMLRAWHAEVVRRKAEAENSAQAHLFYLVSHGRKHLHAWRYQTAWAKAEGLAAAYTASARRQRRWQQWKARYHKHSELKARILTEASWGYNHSQHACPADRLRVGAPDEGRIQLTVLKERAREAAWRAAQLASSLQHSLLAHSVVSGLQLFDFRAAVGRVFGAAEHDAHSEASGDTQPTVSRRATFADAPHAPREGAAAAMRRVGVEDMEVVEELLWSGTLDQSGHMRDRSPSATPPAYTRRWSLVYSPFRGGTGDNTLTRTHSQTNHHQHRRYSPDALKNVVFLGGIEDYVNTNSAKAHRRSLMSMSMGSSPTSRPSQSPSISPAQLVLQASGSRLPDPSPSPITSPIEKSQSTSVEPSSQPPARRGTWPRVCLGMSPDEQSEGPPPRHAECSVLPHPMPAVEATASTFAAQPVLVEASSSLHIFPQPADAAAIPAPTSSTSAGDETLPLADDTTVLPGLEDALQAIPAREPVVDSRRRSADETATTRTASPCVADADVHVHMPPADPLAEGPAVADAAPQSLHRASCFDELNAALDLADAAVMSAFSDTTRAAGVSHIAVPPTMHAAEAYPSRLCHDHPWVSVSPPHLASVPRTTAALEATGFCTPSVSAGVHVSGESSTSKAASTSPRAALSPEVQRQLGGGRERLRSSLHQCRLDSLPSAADGMLTPQAVKPLQRLPLEQALLTTAALTATQRVFLKWRRALRRREAERSALRYHAMKATSVAWAAWRAHTGESVRERRERELEAKGAALYAARLSRTAFTLWQMALMEKLRARRAGKPPTSATATAVPQELAPPKAPSASSVAAESECEWDGVVASMRCISGSPEVRTPPRRPPRTAATSTAATLRPSPTRSSTSTSYPRPPVLRQIQNIESMLFRPTEFRKEGRGVRHTAHTSSKQRERERASPPAAHRVGVGASDSARRGSSYPSFVTEVITDWSNTRIKAKAFRRWFLRVQYEVLTRRRRQQLLQRRCFEAWRAVAVGMRQRASRVARKYWKYRTLSTAFRGWRAGVARSLRRRAGRQVYLARGAVVDAVARGGSDDGAWPPPTSSGTVTPQGTVAQWIETVGPPASTTASPSPRRGNPSRQRSLCSSTLPSNSHASGSDPASSEARARQRLLDLAQRVNHSLKREVRANQQIDQAMDKLNSRYSIAAPAMAQKMR